MDTDYKPSPTKTPTKGITSMESLTVTVNIHGRAEFFTKATSTRDSDKVKQPGSTSLETLMKAILKMTENTGMESINGLMKTYIRESSLMI